MAKEEEQKMKNYKSGKQFGLSGKEMFSFNPDLADDGPMEEGDAVFDSYSRSDDDDDDAAFEYKEVDLDNLAFAAQEVRKSYDLIYCSRLLTYLCSGNYYDYQVDGTGTVALDDRLHGPPPSSKPAAASSSQQNGTESPDKDSIADAAPFNENLFLDEDLDGLDDELNDLDMDD